MASSPSPVVGVMRAHGCCCPHGVSWVSLAVACETGTKWVKRYGVYVKSPKGETAVCRGVGVCDESTGLCLCNEGFEGNSCSRGELALTASGRRSVLVRNTLIFAVDALVHWGWGKGVVRVSGWGKVATVKSPLRPPSHSPLPCGRPCGNDNLHCAAIAILGNSACLWSQWHAQPPVMDAGSASLQCCQPLAPG